MTNAEILEALRPGESAEITWDVTEADISHGKKSDCYKCPIAQSLIREFPGALGASATFGSLYLDFYFVSRLGDYRADAPPAALTFMDEFDRGEPIGPIRLTATFEKLGV